MADIDINPFGEHESRTDEPTDEQYIFLLFWLPQDDQLGNQTKESKKHHLEALRSY